MRSGTLDVAGDRRPCGRGRAAASTSQPRRADGLARAARRPGRAASSPRCPDAVAQRRPASSRLPGNAHFIVPRLRGRLAADAARRPRHRVLDRVGLLGRGGAALARAAGDGRRRGGRARLAAVLARPHLHGGRRRRRRGRDRPGRGARPGALARSWPDPPGTSDEPEAPREGPGRHVRRRRLGGRRGARPRRRPRRHRRAPRAVAQPADATRRARAAAARSRTPATRAGPPT